MGTKNTFKGGLNASLIFTASRIAGYTAMGLLCGLLGQIGKALFPARAVMMTGGIIILIIGINVCHPGNNRVCRKKKLSGLKRTPFQLALLGLLMSLVPCLPCTAIMACAVASGDYIKGGLAAFFFAAGTAISPLYLIGGGAAWLSGRIAAKIPENRNIIRYINGSMIAFMGLRILLSA
jgi:sulfite exporter TauE/SafE